MSRRRRTGGLLGTISGLTPRRRGRRRRGGLIAAMGMGGRSSRRRGKRGLAGAMDSFTGGGGRRARKAGGILAMGIDSAFDGGLGLFGLARGRRRRGGNDGMAKFLSRMSKTEYHDGMGAPEAGEGVTPRAQLLAERREKVDAVLWVANRRLKRGDYDGAQEYIESAIEIREQYNDLLAEEKKSRQSKDEQLTIVGTESRTGGSLRERLAGWARRTFGTRETTVYEEDVEE